MSAGRRADGSLPSWIGLAETTLLLAPSPIIVWATIQNSYNSANSRPRTPQQSVINNTTTEHHGAPRSTNTPTNQRLMEYSCQRCWGTTWRQIFGGNFLDKEMLTFKCEMSLSAGDCEGGDTAVVLLVESVAQDLPR